MFHGEIMNIYNRHKSDDNYVSQLCSSFYLTEMQTQWTEQFDFYIATDVYIFWACISRKTVT